MNTSAAVSGQGTFHSATTAELQILIIPDMAPASTNSGNDHWLSIV